MKSIRQLATYGVVVGTILSTGTIGWGKTANDAKRDLKAGDKGTTLKSITVEGEDRIRIEFDRPALNINVDPLTAPGLEWDMMWTLLTTESLDLYRPLPQSSRSIQSPYRPRPWMDVFRRGDIVRFKPALKGVDTWALIIADSRGGEVKSFKGKGSPPDQIAWDGRANDGTVSLPSHRYSYVVEAADRAGNSRRFVGKGFRLPSYALEVDGHVSLMFTESDMATPTAKTPSAPVFYAATRINQLMASAPVIVEVTTGDYQRANAIANDVARQIRSLVMGDDARITTRATVAKGAEEASIVVHVGPKS
jgi:hypothetical protein